MLSVLFIDGLEKSINRFLRMDSDVSLFLKPLSGKVIEIKIEPMDSVIYLCPSSTGIQLLERYEGKPDTVLSGTPLSFGLMGLSKTPKRALFSGQVRMAGDLEVGRHLQALFEKLEIDWEEQLSHATGDVLAHKLGNIFRAGKAWGKESLKTFELNIAEYLQEETRELPAKAEISIYYRKVDKVRADYDRLEARVQRLHAILTAIKTQ